MAVDRKEEITKAATKSFALFGYKATTMDQVSKIANVGKGTIYTFFANKEELFGEIMDNFIAEVKKVAEAAIDPGRPFSENLHRVLYNVLDFRSKHELAVQLAHEINEVGTPMAREGMRKIEEALQVFVENQVREAVGKRELKPCDPEMTAFVLIRLYIAFVYEWEAKAKEPLEKSKILELFELYVMNGLANPAAR